MDKFLSEIWGGAKLFLDMRNVLAADEKILAVIMAANEKNYDRFMAVSEFREILHSLNLKANIHSVQSAQVGVINAISSSKISRSRLVNSLKRLKDESIISDSELDRLESFIKSVSQNFKEEGSVKSLKKDFFHSKTNALDAIYEKLLAIVQEGYLEDRLKEAKRKNDELTFNIVVTGVINSGKSTLLNALLGAKILGSSNVPETANLTIIKRSQSSFAKVKFWNEDELKELDCEISDEAKNFAGKEIEVQTQDLKSYTTAKNEISKAVKSVELYENLELLRDGISIVDTPGIDDAVFLREKLVRRYMSECDLMVHLMNVSQSATQKDIDFLISSLKNSHIARLVVVLTHADLLNAQELNEVVSYAKKSIKEKLKSNGLNQISNDINFFTISARRFFEGDENSGVESFKEYLYEIFFGEENEKSRLSFESYKKELIAISSEFLEQVKASLMSLTGSNLELSRNLKTLSERKNALTQEFKAIRETAINEFEKIDIKGLDADFFMELKRITASVKDRVLNEVDFAKRRKEKIDEKRIEYIVKTLLNDGILNAARIKRNDILKKIKSCVDNINLKFDDFDISIDEKVFNLNDYLNERGAGFGYLNTAQRICKFISSKELENVIDKELDDFLKNDKTINFVFDLIKFEKDQFDEKINRKMNERRKIFEMNEDRLAKESEILNETSDEIARNLDRLQSLKDRLDGILEELKNA